MYKADDTLFYVPAAVPYTLVAALGCTDDDSGAFGTLTYSIAQSPGSGDFSVAADVVTMDGN